MENIVTENKIYSDIEKRWRIERPELEEDIKAILSEYFRAKIIRQKEGIDLTFYNGQRFVIRTEER